MKDHTFNPFNDGSDKESDKESTDLDQRIRASFDQLGYPQMNGIQCRSDAKQIVLQGEVDSFYLKQVAQSIAKKANDGVRAVENNIIVRSHYDE